MVMTGGWFMKFAIPTLMANDPTHKSILGHWHLWCWGSPKFGKLPCWTRGLCVFLNKESDVLIGKEPNQTGLPCQREPDFDNVAPTRTLSHFLCFYHNSKLFFFIVAYNYHSRDVAFQAIFISVKFDFLFAQWFFLLYWQTYTNTLVQEKKRDTKNPRVYHRFSHSKFSFCVIPIFDNCVSMYVPLYIYIYIYIYIHA